nr:helix-turn-helix transcriptional regulator [Cribrihabitans marinus]
MRIKEIRKRKGMSQEELAGLIDLSRPYLAQIESGARNLTAKKQEMIAAALEVDPVELVDFSAPDQDDEKMLLMAFRSLNPEQRKAWLGWAQVALGSDSQDQDA